MKYNSIYRGIVTSNKDPKKRGRVKVICPDVLGGEAESAWCDPCTSFIADKGGDFFVPKVDEAVWVMFEDGDCNSPVYLGSWWSNNNTPLKEKYSDKELRIIGYEDCNIIMKSGTLVIEVGDSDKTIKVEKGKVTLTCDVQITGNLNVKGSISATGSVTGSNIK